MRADGTPGGLALLERQLRQLRALGHGPVTLLLGPDVPAAVEPDARVAATRRVPTDDPGAALAVAAAELPGEFLLLSADHLIDPRVLRYAAAAPGDALVVDASGVRHPVGRLARATLVAHGSDALARARALPLDAI